MFRIIVIVAFVVALSSALAYQIEAHRVPGTAASAPAPLAPTSAGISLLPEMNTIEVTGTLIYYPNNAGISVPYIVYELPRGIATKALIFSRESRCDTPAGAVSCALIQHDASSRFRQRLLRVEGTPENEHMVVRNLSVL